MTVNEPNVEIRLATEQDADVLFPMAHELAMSFDIDRAGFDQMFSELLASDSCVVIIAEVESTMRGYVLGFDHPTFFANGRVSWVEELFVEKQFRRQGIAAALMKAFEQWSNDRNVKMVALATRRAAPFYLAINYEESATYFRKVL